MRPLLGLAVVLTLGCASSTGTGDATVDANLAEADAANLDGNPPDEGAIEGGIDGDLAPARLTITPAHALLQCTAGYGTGVDVLVKNTGDVPTGSLLMSMSGPDASKFTILRGNCPTDLVAGRTCLVYLYFEDPDALPDVRVAAARVLRRIARDEIRVRVADVLATVRDETTRARIAASLEDVDAAEEAALVHSAHS